MLEVEEAMLLVDEATVEEAEELGQVSLTYSPLRMSLIHVE